MGRFSVILLDTCALLRNAFDKKKLSQLAKERMEESDSLMISSISIWEIGIKIKKGKLKIPISLKEFVANLQNADNLTILAIDEKTWIDSLDLDWDHKDPADRVIVASSKARNIELITSDSAILNFYHKAIW